MKELPALLPVAVMLIGVPLALAGLVSVLASF